MKKIDLIETPMELPNGREETFSYSDTIALIVSEARGNNPFTPDDIMAAVSIKQKLKEKPASLLLENHEYRFLKDRVNSYPWAIANQAILGFIDAVRNAQDCDVKEAKK